MRNRRAPHHHSLTTSLKETEAIRRPAFTDVSGRETGPAAPEYRATSTATQEAQTQRLSLGLWNGRGGEGAGSGESGLHVLAAFPEPVEDLAVSGGQRGVQVRSWCG